MSEPYILVVDDEWLNRELLETYLVMGGYQVRLANSGEIALRIAQAEPPTLVMLDVRLSGMDGYDVCRCLKDDSHTSHVPVLLVTALVSEEDRQQGRYAGADGFLAKPFSATELLERIRLLIDRA